MTGSTKSSKANAYAATAVKEVTKQYVSDIEKMNKENKRLLALLASRNVTPESANEATTSPQKSDDSDLVDPSDDDDSNMNGSERDLGEDNGGTRTDIMEAEDTPVKLDNNSPTDPSDKDDAQVQEKEDYVLRSMRYHYAVVTGKQDKHDFDDSDKESAPADRNRWTSSEEESGGPDKDDNEIENSSHRSSDCSTSDVDMDEPIELSGDEESLPTPPCRKGSQKATSMNLDEDDNELTTPPCRKAANASKLFSPRKDANPRPYRLCHFAAMVTGSEGLGVGDSD